MAEILKTTVSNALSWWTICFYFASNFTKEGSRLSNWQFCSIGSGYGLAPDRRQAITWTNADPVHQRIYAAPGRNELKQCSLEFYILE